MHESFLAYKNQRWLRAGLLLVAACIIAYCWHSPRVPPNGATWLGYTLGTIGALLILWLMLLGIRKRRYSSTLGTVKGWLSAHVYLGLALLFVATLHTGFQFGWNLHTLAYGLMCVVIASGICGVLFYWRYPTLMSEARGSQTTVEMLKSLADYDNQLQRCADKLPQQASQVVSSSIAGTEVGGRPWQLVKANDRSSVTLPGGKPRSNANQQTAIAWLAENMGDASVTAGQTGAERQTFQDTLTLLGNKQALLIRLRQYSQLQAMLQVWLFLHIPLSFGLLAALISHIIVVFFYW